MSMTEERPAVLSLGFTRGLWDGEGAEDVIRLRAYAARLSRYVVLVNAYRRHGLRPIRLADGFDAIPTNASGPVGSFVRMLRLGRQLLQRERFDLVQGQDPFFTGLAAWLLARMAGLPVNVCVYGPNVFDPHWSRATRGSAVMGPLGRFVLRRADGVQVDGRLTATRLMASGIARERVTVKPMVPANLGALLDVPRAAKSADAPVRLLFVGRLERQKNLPLLAEVFRELRAEGLPVELELVGAGAEEADLRVRLAAETRAGAVRWTGSVGREQIPGIFAGADVFVLTSDYEGFPRVLMEAAAAGLPVVCTHVSGADEMIVDGESGWIVPIGDASGLVACLRAVVQDAELRRRAGARARRHAADVLADRRNDEEQLTIWRGLIRRNRKDSVG